MDFIQYVLDSRQPLDSLEPYIKEWLEYLKLRQLPQFASLDHPIYTRRLPELTKARNKDVRAYWGMSTAQDIIDYLIIEEDPLPNILEINLKKQKQLLLIGKPVDVTIEYKDLSTFDMSEETNIIYQITNSKDNILNIALITQHQNEYRIYLGTELVDQDFTKRSNKKLKPYRLVENGREILIYHYSAQGNNDYTIGTIDGEALSMPNNTIVQVGDKQFHLTDEEQQTWAIDRIQTKDAARFLLSVTVPNKEDSMHENEE